MACLFALSLFWSDGCILGSMLKALRYLSPSQWPHFQLVNHSSLQNMRVNVSGLQSIKVGVCVGFPLLSNPLHLKQRAHSPCWLPSVDPLIYVFMCAHLSVCMGTSMQVPMEVRRRLANPPELESQEVGSGLIWLLGAERGSSVRAASVLIAWSSL